VKKVAGKGEFQDGRQNVRRPHSSKPTAPAAAGLLLWARRTDFDRLLDRRSAAVDVQRANAGSVTLSAYVGSTTHSCL